MPYLVGRRTVYLVGERREEFPVYNLAEGEVQDYVKLKAELKAKGQKFVDKTFDPDTMDILDKDFLGQVPFAGQLQAWKRPRDVNPNKVFSEKDEKGNPYGHADVIQGKLGDCFYLAALSIVADNPRLTNFVIPEDNNEDEELGIFHFRFWRQGFFFDIVVDDRIPYGMFGPLGAKVHGNEIWPLLIEKAYAKLYGSYGEIDGGSTNDALEDFTGGLVDSYQLSRGTLAWEAFSPKGTLTQTFAGFSTREGPTPDTVQDPESGLCFGHAYAVLGREEFKNNAGETVRLLKIRNPHAQSDWRGAWCDWPTPSPLWDTIPAADKDRLLVSKNDGEFWMTLEDTAHTIFDAAVFCYWLDDLDKGHPDAGQKFQWQELHGEWRNPSTSGLGDGWAQLANNPQFRINLKNTVKEHEGKGTLIYSLLKKGKSPKNPPDQFRTEVFTLTDPNMANDPLPYPVQVFGRQLKQEKETMANQRANPLQQARERFCGALLNEGTYVLIPIWEAGKEGRFLLRVLSEGASRVEASPIPPGTLPLVQALGPPSPPAPLAPSTGEQYESQDDMIKKLQEKLNTRFQLPPGGPRIPFVPQPPQQPSQADALESIMKALQAQGLNIRVNPNSSNYQYDPYNRTDLSNLPYYNNWNANGGFSQPIRVNFRF